MLRVTVSSSLSYQFSLPNPLSMYLGGNHHNHNSGEPPRGVYFADTLLTLVSQNNYI